MNKKIKFRILSYVAFFVIFFTVWMILHFTFENLESAYKGMISAGFAGLLVPTINEYETQSGKKMQLKWIFLRKPISI